MTAQTILPANTLSSGDFVTNSARFESAQLLRTNSGSTATNVDKYTVSVWLKRSKLGVDSNIIADVDGSGNYYQIYFKSDDTLRWQETGNGDYITTRKFRDVGAWYHIVCRYDSSLGTAGDRMRIYINGVEETSFGTSDNPDQNDDGHFAETNSAKCIADNDADGREFFGYMCEFMGVDGQSLAPTSFGEFDSDSGIWTPIDISGITQGVHGFYLQFQDSSDLGTATLGADWAPTALAATDQSTDTCQNNFATWNGLDFYHNATANTGSTSSEGNLRFANASGNKGFARSTFAVSSGKWYWEIEANAVGKGFYGVCHEGIMVDGTALQPSAIYYYEAVPDFRSGDQIITTNAVSISAGDILGFALDMDNSALYISKNGTYMNSGNPGSGSSRTGSIAELFNDGRAVLSNFGAIFANVANTSTSGALDASANFGSPHYSESGGNADGNGFGNFKTAPPSGYLALCTKNLGSTGG